MEAQYLLAMNPEPLPILASPSLLPRLPLLQQPAPLQTQPPNLPLTLMKLMWIPHPLPGLHLHILPYIQWKLLPMFHGAAFFWEHAAQRQHCFSTSLYQLSAKSVRDPVQISTLPLTQEKPLGPHLGLLMGHSLKPPTATALSFLEPQVPPHKLQT